MFPRLQNPENRTDHIQTAKSTEAYNEFWEMIHPNSARYGRLLDIVSEAKTNKAQREKHQKAIQELLLQKFLDINPEGSLLQEIKDIQDELNMITKIFTEQLTVVGEFALHLDQLAERSSEVTQRTKSEISRLEKEILRRKAEVVELTHAADRTAHGVSSQSPYLRALG